MGKGKYTAVKKLYPAFKEEPSYQKLVDDTKMLILGTLDGEGANAGRLGAILETYYKKKEALFEVYHSKDKTDAEYEINLAKKALSQLLVEAFESEGLKNSIGLASGATVYLEDTPIPVVKDKPAAMKKLFKAMPELLTFMFKGLNQAQIRSLSAWAKREKVPIEPGIHDQTLKAVVRDHAVQGKPAPAGTEIFFLTQAKLKNGNKGEES